jgi:protein TonB
MTPIFPLPPFAEPTRAPVTHGLGVALVDGGLPVPRIDARPIDGIDASALRFMIDVPTPSGPLFARIPSGDGTPIESSLADDPPMLLAGPAAVYPDLLRQAGIHGRVVLEVVIDTLGRVERGSVVVVESAHPAFVASAQQSLLKSLFRPARVQGKAVRVRVRLPIDFVLRDGRLQG